jgi:DNA-binding CsgD family transcriptional regulator
MVWIRPPAFGNPAAPLETLLYTIQMAATHPDLWRSVLDTLNHHIGGFCSVLAKYDFQSARGKLLTQAPANIDVRSSYEEMSPTNPYFLARRGYTPGAVLVGSETISDSDLIRTDYYRELLRPHRLFRRLTGVLSVRESDVTLVSIHRTREQPDFDEREQQTLAKILPYLALGLETQDGFFTFRTQLEALSLTVRQALPPLMIVDSDLNIVVENSETETLLGTDLLQRTKEGRLASVDSFCDRALRDEINRCCALGASGDCNTHPLALMPAHKSRAELRLCYIGKGLSTQTLRRISLVCVMRVDAQGEARERFLHFSREFNLTPAQARVGELVIGGMRPSIVARTLSLSENTVKTHLKQIFKKTGVHSQLDLFRLYRVPAGVPAATDEPATHHPYR